MGGHRGARRAADALGIIAAWRDSGAKERAQLPDSAFASIDAKGRRRLPINDAAHVRNALARVGQVELEDEAARDRAGDRLLTAAEEARDHADRVHRRAAAAARRLTQRQITFLLTDIESSTELLARLDDEYADLLADVRRRVRSGVRRAGGHEVSARGDDVFAVFEAAPAALEAALAIQRAMRAALARRKRRRLRIGLHRGRPQLTETGYVGISVHAAARICFAAHGGQIVLSSAVRAALGDSLPDDVGLSRLGGGGSGAARFRWRSSRSTLPTCTPTSPPCDRRFLGRVFQ